MFSCAQTSYWQIIQLLASDYIIKIQWHLCSKRPSVTDDQVKTSTPLKFTAPSWGNRKAFRYHTQSRPWCSVSHWKKGHTWPHPGGSYSPTAVLLLRSKWTDEGQTGLGVLLGRCRVFLWNSKHLCILCCRLCRTGFAATLIHNWATQVPPEQLPERS